MKPLLWNRTFSFCARPWSLGTTTWPIVTALAIILVSPHIAFSATFQVVISTDAPDANPGDGKCETDLPGRRCTLRAAIEESNAGQGGQIKLPPLTYVLTRGTPLEIKTSLSLTGEDPTSTVIDGNHQVNGPVIIVTGERTSVSMSGITVQNGGAPFSLGGTGGIRVGFRTGLSLFNCIITNNRGAPGAGILNEGVLRIFNSIISQNKTRADARGAIFIGGGIYSNGELIIDRSTINQNEASRGGGIFNNGDLEITNSTIFDNSAGEGGGGIFNFEKGRTFIAFSTITSNVAGHDVKSRRPVNERTGGGILNLGGEVSMGNTILAGNEVQGEARARNIVGPDCFNVPGFNGTLHTAFGNLIGIAGDNCDMRIRPGATRGFDRRGRPDEPVNPGFGNVIFGETIALNLLDASLAINHGIGRDASEFFNCPQTDQRGFSRPLNFSNDPLGNCDAGAVEVGSIPPRKVTAQIALASQPKTRFSASSTPTGPAGTFFITATFTNRSAATIRKPFFQVLELSEGNLLLNSDTGMASVGATLTPNVGPDRLLRSGESFEQEFRIGLQTEDPFSFVVDLFGDPPA